MMTVGTEVQRALVFHIGRSQKDAKNTVYEMEEAVNLTRALGVECVGWQSLILREIGSGTFLGRGKITEIKDQIQAMKADLVVMNTVLSPIQQRNLERLWQAKVIDRTGLILEIFARRAVTKEGRLQVELARLDYERSRLVRTWTHLERQRGGQGFLAGPGETQIESDRRMLAEKIGRLKRDLKNVRRTRGLQRLKRKRAPERVVALVGYTNAGKSSLFNRLTKSDVLVKDMVFATLDTKHRVLELPGGKPAVLSDTVGFISDLPTHLIEAFQATLEDVKEADLLIHVRDISDPLSERRRDQVLSVLNAIEAGPEHGQMMIECWNKSDLLKPEDKELQLERARVANMVSPPIKADAPLGFLVSCHNGEGIKALSKGIETALSSGDHNLVIDISPSDYAVRAWLHENGTVLGETTNEVGCSTLSVRLSDVDVGKLRARYAHMNI